MAVTPASMAMLISDASFAILTLGAAPCRGRKGRAQTMGARPARYCPRHTKVPSFRLR